MVKLIHFYTQLPPGFQVLKDLSVSGAKPNLEELLVTLHRRDRTLAIPHQGDTAGLLSEPWQQSSYQPRQQQKTSHLCPWVQSSH